MATKLRSYYDGEQKKHSQAASLSKFEETLTEQSHKDACDINTLLRKNDAGALNLAALVKENPVYGDFSSMPSYQEALQLVETAGTQFALLDAKLRARFENDPAQFLAFIHDPKNEKEVYDLGLATKKEQPDKTSLKDVVEAIKAPTKKVTQTDS